MRQLLTLTTMIVKQFLIIVALTFLLTGCSSMGKFMQDVGQNQMAHNNHTNSAPAKKMTCKQYQYGTLTEMECE